MSSEDRCPRCSGRIEGMPAGSRVTPERDIIICGLCAGEEAMFEARNPDTPLPPIEQRVPVDMAYDLDDPRDQWGQVEPPAG